MARLVVKFGGTSVADIERIRHAAMHVKREVDARHEVTVVVSAQAGETNRLVKLCRDVSNLHDIREYDTVVAAGEQISAGLMSIMLQSMGLSSRSWLGWQIPMITDNSHGMARIKNVEGNLLIERMSQGEIPVVAGFQGITPRNRISTLGRGGSDTSAVAIAAAVNADRCDIYTDVDGVYTADPRLVPRARRMDRISFEEMLELSALGAKVLQVRSVELAMQYKVPLMVRSTFDNPQSESSKKASIGTIVCDEEEILEQHVVNGIAHTNDEAKIMLTGVADRPGVASRIFVPLADHNINVDMIVQNTSRDGKTTDITFTVPKAEYERSMELLKGLKEEIEYKFLEGEEDVSKISVVGLGMRSHVGVAAKVFQTLANRSINIKLITTSEIKVSVLIDAPYTELAVRVLHSAFDLDAQH